MAQLSSLKSVIRDSGESPAVGRLAGFGSIFGIVAAALGLISGTSLVPVPSLAWEQTSDSPFAWELGGSAQFPLMMIGFMALMAVSLVLQYQGSKDLRAKLGSGLSNVIWIAAFTAFAIIAHLWLNFSGVIDDSQISGFLGTLYMTGSLFVVTWQLSSVIYTDSSKTWIGFLAGMLNALFIPVLALGQALAPALIYAAYGLLLVGQLMSLLFWWSPFDGIREYARSPAKAKIAFGLSGFLTFAIGFLAVLIGPLSDVSGVTIWNPWSTLSSPTTFQTNPALVFALLAMMIYWIMLSPRLGARELKAAAIGEDIVKGGSKILMLFLAVVGIIASTMSSTFVEGIGGWGFFLVMAPAGIMFLMGALYAAKTDIITGIPLVFTSIFLMIHPFTLSGFVIYPWLIIIVTQFLLMIESWWRGFTGFSQPVLTVIISLVASVMLIVIMLGGFGSGPLALWPTNRWFNITLIPGIPAAIQSATIIVLPLLVVFLRNVSLAGYSYGRGYATGGVLMGASFLFAFIVPIIAGNQSIGHEANTGAALLLALYSISVVLVLSLNLNLANDVEDEGHRFEGNLIKVSTIAGLLAAGAVIVLALVLFAGLPTPGQIAFIVSIMVTFVVSTEVLSIIGWFVAGLRLGMLKIPRLAKPEL
ncbi:MAG: hypothetical protein ACXABE_10125 [Candidatus Thorarchaeota archaeon]|jgi:hypothetical protein